MPLDHLRVTAATALVADRPPPTPIIPTEPRL